MQIWVINAFADGIGKGGPAGVVMYDKFPADSQMLAISSALNFSNSAFIVEESPNQFYIRWFTTNSEAPLCGHATFATLEMLSKVGKFPSGANIKFRFRGGELYASNNNNFFTISFPKLAVNPTEFLDSYFAVVGVSPKYCATDGTCLLLDFEEFEILKSLKPNLELLKKLDYRAIIATASGPSGFDFSSRYFAPKVGINEDPVCVSAHTRLVPYWSEVLNKTDLIAFQASQRGALLKCKLDGDRVLVSGSCFLVGVFEHDEASDRISLPPFKF